MVLVSVVEVIVRFGRCNVPSLLRGSLATKVYGVGGLVVFDENLLGPEGWDDMFVEDVVDDAVFMLIVVVCEEGLVPVEASVTPLRDLVASADDSTVPARAKDVTVAVRVTSIVALDAWPVCEEGLVSVEASVSPLRDLVASVDASTGANDVTVAVHISAVVTAMVVLDAWPESMTVGTGANRLIVSVGELLAFARADDATAVVCASAAATSMSAFDVLSASTSTIDGIGADLSIVGASEIQDATPREEDAVVKSGEAVDTPPPPVASGALVGAGYTNGVGPLLVEAWRVPLVMWTISIRSCVVWIAVGTFKG